MRFSTASILFASGFMPQEIAASNKRTKTNLRQNNSAAGHSTFSDECTLLVEKGYEQRVFKCELDPADMNGEIGHVRTLKVTPDQHATLERMLAIGDVKLGSTSLIHGEGVAFDDEHIHIPQGLDMMKTIHRRDLQGLFDTRKNSKGNGNGNGKEKKTVIIEFANKQDATSGPKCNALAKANGGKVKNIYTAVLNGCACDLPQSAIDALSKNKNIKTIEPDSVVTASQVPSWGLDRVNQNNLPLDNYSEKVDAAGVKVFIVDTGIRGTHQDFAVGETSMISTDTSCHHSSVGGSALSDVNGHGTHVASTACGSTYGVAKNCEVCAVKVLGDDGSGSSSGVIAGYDHVTQYCSAGNKLCVFNASLGGGFSSAGNTAVANAAAAGVVPVVAAGNSNDDACGYSPASASSAITVGSTTSSDGVSSFSNWGGCVDVYAPGSGITAAWPTTDTSTRTISGTSMASPHVAGIAAGVLSANPQFSPGEVDNKIKANVASGWSGDSRSPGAGLATTTFGSSGTPPPSPAPPAPTPCTGMDVEVKILTDNYPGETAWTVKKNECGTDEIFSGSSFSSPGAWYTDSLCLPQGKYDFTITDVWGDGICCGYGNGAYEIKVDGVSTLTGGEFGASETKTFGSCSAGPQSAVYDPSLGVPKCGNVGSSCTSGDEMLDGKANNNELNSGNSLFDSCPDGPFGSYHADESVDKITIMTLDGGAFVEGKTVEVKAKFWAYGTMDGIDIFYTGSAANPSWTRIHTFTGVDSGLWTGAVQYTLPAGGLQAVRVQNRYFGSSVACNGGDWDDVDDLAFAVAAPSQVAALGIQTPPKATPLGTGILTSASCTEIIDKKRCESTEASMCEWHNGKHRGCHAKGN